MWAGRRSIRPFPTAITEHFSTISWEMPFPTTTGWRWRSEKIHCFSPSWESVICWSDTETRPTAMRKRKSSEIMRWRKTRTSAPSATASQTFCPGMLLIGWISGTAWRLSQPGPWWRMPGRAEMEMRRISRDIFRDWIRGKCLCRRIWSVCWDPMRGRMSFLSDCGSRCRGKFSGSDLRWSGPMARKW